MIHLWSQIIIMLRKSIAFLAAASTLSPIFLDDNQTPDTKRHAICILYPSQSNARGLASFSQDSISSPVKVACSLKGLSPNGKHGIHIHQFGDLTQGATTTGSHYNPQNKKHGSPFVGERHAGDLGNLLADPFGNAYMCFSDSQINLYGEFSIVGRSVVVCANQDDLGRTKNADSVVDGNSGGSLACGVIGLAKEFKTVAPVDS